MLLIDREWLGARGLRVAVAHRHDSGRSGCPPTGVDLEDVERQLLVQALERAAGNQTHAGQLLGINRDQVRYRIEKFGLTPPGYPRASAADTGVAAR